MRVANFAVAGPMSRAIGRAWIPRLPGQPDSKRAFARGVDRRARDRRRPVRDERAMLADTEATHDGSRAQVCWMHRGGRHVTVRIPTTGSRGGDPGAFARAIRAGVL